MERKNNVKKKKNTLRKTFHHSKACDVTKKLKTKSGKPIE